MLRFFLLLLPAALLVSCGGNSPGDKKVKAEESAKDAGVFGVESGIVEYTFSDDSLQHEILWFDRWGTRTATLHYSPGFDSTLSITDGPMSYTIDLRTMDGMKLKNPFGMSSGGSIMGYQEERQQRLGGGVNNGTEEFLGKRCDLWQLDSDVMDMKSTTLLYKGITLKLVVDVDGEVSVMEAVKFDENAKVPDEKFAVPAGVSF